MSKQQHAAADAYPRRLGDYMTTERSCAAAARSCAVDTCGVSLGVPRFSLVRYPLFGAFLYAFKRMCFAQARRNATNAPSDMEAFSLIKSRMVRSKRP